MIPPYQVVGFAKLEGLGLLSEGIIEDALVQIHQGQPLRLSIQLSSDASGNGDLTDLKYPKPFFR
jgi:hypothetical protein